MPLPVSGVLHDPFLLSNGIDKPHSMKGCELQEFALDGGKVPRLDLDEEVAPDDIDEIAVNRRLMAIVRKGVPRLEGGVEWFLV